MLSEGGIAEKAGAILITQVKNNQPSLLKQIEHGCQTYKPMVVILDEVDKKNGRIMQWKYEIFEASPMLNKWLDEWLFIKKNIKVTRFRYELGIDEKPSITTSYYISNGELAPEEFKTLTPPKLIPFF
ncbi:hypothetical protein FACS1894122_14650 [Alphaproteobacteria bacterium]|nr:hypothetical protein FACS1894122_14650 [Alphaproteobacteria bacterium]